MNKVTLIVGVAILGLLMVSAAQATIISQHVGDNDPTTEGFTANTSPGGSADAGPPANWKMVTAARVQGFYIL
ncbi:MAG: hypothetical protein K8R46_04495 [Pirellulales bacterium]|nr:hypothetical protein [Pirellulales bacterium]